jgi:outer membrane biosynthesis protein TonB
MDRTRATIWNYQRALNSKRLEHWAEMSAAEKMSFESKELCDRLADVTARAATMTGNGNAALAAQQGDALVTLVSHGVNAPSVGVPVLPSSFAGQCFAQGKLLVCDNVANDPRVDANTCWAMGIGSMVAAPLIAQDKTLGVLAVFAQEPNAFSRSQLELVNTLAIVAGELLSPDPANSQSGKQAQEQRPAVSNDSESTKQKGAQPKVIKMPGPEPVPQFCASTPEPAGHSRLLIGSILLAVVAVIAVVSFVMRGHKSEAPATQMTASSVTPQPSPAETSTAATPSAPEKASSSPQSKEKSTASSPPAQTSTAQAAQSAPRPQPMVIRSGAGNGAQQEVAPPVLQLTSGTAPISFSAKPYVPNAPAAAITPAVLVRKVAPTYPSSFSGSGTVSLTATIQKDGKLTNVKATDGPLPLRQAAANALRQWQYRPAFLNGKTVDSTVEIKINFSRR